MGNGVLQRFPLPHKYMGHATLETSLIVHENKMRITDTTEYEN